MGGFLPAGVFSVDEADRLTQAFAHPRRVDQQVIDYFRRLLAEHYTADKMLGPRQLLGPVMSQLDVLDTLCKQARPPVAKPLLRTLAQYAEFVGLAPAGRRRPPRRDALVGSSHSSGPSPQSTPSPPAERREHRGSADGFIWGRAVWQTIPG